MFLSIREGILDEAGFTSGSEHDFPVPASLVAQFQQPIRPLEPFRRYLDASDDYHLTDQNWRAVLIQAPRRATIRADILPSSNHDHTAICRAGHRISLRTHGLLKSIRKGRDACLYCANRSALPGYNDLSTTHPRVARELHPTRNGELTPENIVAGMNDKVWWLCPEGDDYEARVNSRTYKGSGCPYCSGWAARSGINDLGTLRPDLAAEWDRERNTRGPDTVTPGSGYMAWWLCGGQHHSYPSRVSSRARGKGCPKCSGRSVRTGENDIATRRPDLADEWDRTANGPLTPDKVALYCSKPVGWLCSEVHSYWRPPAERARGRSCPYCQGDRLLPGFNDLRTKHALLSREWHKSNHVSDPGLALPDGKKRLWECEYGHRHWQTLANRVRSLGCPKCPREQRILRSSVDV